MMDNLATARKDLDKINRAFFVPESLDIEEAAKVAKKPRLGDAEFLSAYTGERCLFKYKFLKSSLVMYIHQRINLNIQAGVTKHEPDLSMCCCSLSCHLPGFD